MLSEKHRGNLTGHWSFYTCRLVHLYGITTVSRIRFIVSCGMEGYDIRLLPREFPTNHVVINDIMADRAVEVAKGIYFHGNHGNLSHCERPNHGNYFLYVNWKILTMIWPCHFSPTMRGCTHKQAHGCSMITIAQNQIFIDLWGIKRWFGARLWYFHCPECRFNGYWRPSPMPTIKKRRYERAGKEIKENIKMG